MRRVLVGAGNTEYAARTTIWNLFPRNCWTNPNTIEKGHAVFESICKFCHGKTAYPGKAPKLNPSRYTPEFVYDRVTNGFRGMPAWKEQYTEEERRAVTVFIMSKKFSN